MAAGAGALCAMAVGLAALLFFKKRKKVKQPETQAALEAGSVRAAIEAANRSEGEDAEQHEQAQLSALASLKLAGATTKKSELLRKEIRDSAKKDVIAATQILQGWIQEGK
jgi:flagellar biosynthesis/type III secretory pathway M-ring protein FliF/YscJ